MSGFYVFSSSKISVTISWICLYTVRGTLSLGWGDWLRLYGLFLFSRIILEIVWFSCLFIRLQWVVCQVYDYVTNTTKSGRHYQHQKTIERVSACVTTLRLVSDSGPTRGGTTRWHARTRLRHYPPAARLVPLAAAATIVNVTNRLSPDPPTHTQGGWEGKDSLNLK